jgi:hypothetical protein
VIREPEIHHFPTLVNVDHDYDATSRDGLGNGLSPNKEKYSIQRVHQENLHSVFGNFVFFGNKSWSLEQNILQALPWEKSHVSGWGWIRVECQLLISKIEIQSWRSRLP